MRLPPHIRWIQRDWLSCNQVLLTGGEGPVLIDTGHVATITETLDILTTTGIAPQSLRWIVNTHAHIDHFGGNWGFRDITNTPLVCGPLTAQFFANNDRKAMWLDHVSDTLFPQSQSLPIPADIVIMPGDVIELGAYRFQVLAVPGHAPDMIALFQPETRILLGSDAMMLGDCGVMNIMVWEDAVEQALETMRLLRSLRADLVLPGHGPIITQVTENIDTVEAILKTFQTRPDKLCRHLFARSIVFLLLAIQPVTREQATHWLLDFTPTQRCADFFGVSKHQLISSFLDTFLERGVLRQQEDGRLVVPATPQ